MVRDYSKTKLYRFPVGNKTYFGHTIQTLDNREKGHKSSFRNGCNMKVYVEMRKQGLNENNIKLIWIENYPCNNVQEARARERWWIENYGDLNGNIPNRTNEEWRHANANHLKEYNKKWREANKDKIAEKRRQDKEKAREYQRAYNKANKERIEKRRKAYEEAHKNEIAEYRREYYARNKNALNKKSRDIYNANKEQILAKRKKKLRQIISNP